MTEPRDAVLTPLFRRHTRRPRLTALLDEARAQSILLTAPAGYGKTTLAREWLQGRTDTAWYHATAASADVGAFSAGLAEAVGPIVPGAGERVRQRLRVGDATERLARPLAELLAEDLDAWPEGGIIVLDDYHLLAESTPVEDFVDWLLMLAPIRLLVTGRRRPGWATARRFLYGEAVEIGRDQLAMTNEEAARVLEGRSTEAVRALVKQAEGWPALIGLASLSAELDFPTGRMSDSLFRYFAEEVFRSEPPDVQRFMLQASVGSSVSVRLAREVLGFEDPEPILERLRDEDLLHEAAREGELRFHPLLREFLRRRLETDDAAAFAERAALVVEDAKAEGRWEEAFDLSVETGNVKEAAEIAGRAARPLLAAGQSETLEKWLDACGAAGVTVAGAALARAELLIRKGEMSAAAALAEDTVRRLDESHQDFPWACTVAGRALHFTSKEHEAFARFESARHHARTDEDLKEALWGQVLAVTEIAPESMDDYLDALDARFADDLDVRFRLAVGRYGVAEQTSSIAGEWQRFAALLSAVEHSTDPLAVTSFLATAATVTRLRGRFSESRALAERTFRICSEFRFDFGASVCLFSRAGAELGLRRFLQAHRTLRLYEGTTIRREDPFYRVEGLTLRARLLAVEGDLDGALATYDEMGRLVPPTRALGIYLSTLAMILAARGDVAEARDTAERARANGTNIEMQHCSTLAEVIADGAEGQTKRFKRKAIDTTVACGESDYLEGLVLAYRLWPHVLDAVATDSSALPIVRDLLGQSRDYELAEQAGIAVSSGEVEDRLKSLTKREREVLTLLALGLTNGEIASRLYIAPSTAKVHVRHIFKKLGASNRLQAVILARELFSEPER